jgi:aspartokinase
VAVVEGLGAVAAIGAGINASSRNLRRTLTVLAEEGIEVAAISTSSFRISLLTPEARVKDAVRRLHRELIEPDPTLNDPLG